MGVGCEGWESAPGIRIGRIGLALARRTRARPKHRLKSSEPNTNGRSAAIRSPRNRSRLTLFSENRKSNHPVHQTQTRTAPGALFLNQVHCKKALRVLLFEVFDQCLELR